MCEHYVAHGLCTDFPDWTIATAGSERDLKTGYEYARLVTGEEQRIGADLEEEVLSDGDHLVPDPLEERSMVATSAEVQYTCMFALSFTWHTVLYCEYSCMKFTYYL